MAMQGLQGLTGLTPTVVPNAVTDPGATAEQIHGTTANPAHGQAQWDSPVPWAIQHGLDLTNQPSPGTGAGLLGGTPDTLGSGQDPDGYADPTSTFSHAAPWPWQHIPNSGSARDAEAAALQSQANQLLHSIDSGDPAAFTENLQGAPVIKMPWDLTPDYNRQGAEEGTPVGGLTGNNHTGWDRYAGWAVPGDNINRFGFDQAHIHRQNPNGTLPVPDTTMQGVQRPMVMNVPGRYGSYPVGQGSPFQPQTQAPGVGNNIGAAEIGVPSDYTPPPDAPTNAPIAQTSGGAAPVWGLSSLGY